MLIITRFAITVAAVLFQVDLLQYDAGHIRAGFKQLLKPCFYYLSGRFIPGDDVNAFINHSSQHAGIGDCHNRRRINNNQVKSFNSCNKSAILCEEKISTGLT